VLDLSLPTGLRDLLPDHSAHLAELSGRLQQVFASFGYRRLFLPTLERLDVVERGRSTTSSRSRAALADVMKFVEPGSGEVVAIRPDITPQIARLYAARPDALPSPARLCYDGPVLRAREARAGRPREVYQAGVELLGAGGPRYDAEALVVLGQALAKVGLGAAVIEVGHARFAAAAIEAAGLPRKVLAEAWDGLARKDEGVLTRLAARGRGSPKARAALPGLAGLYGDGALTRARAFARAVPACAPALAEVEAALRLATRRGLGAVAVDLGEARGLGYYTGITFAGYAPGAGAAVAAGGRYDELLGRFGRPGPAIGFGIDLEFATQALERSASATPRRKAARAARRR
jgi:ATP phosphoribosyltransferase regulatory subunit